MTSCWFHKWPRTPKSEPSSVGICGSMLPYAHGQHINVLEHFVHVWYGCRKQFEVAVSLNHAVMTSFSLHMSDPEPQNLSQVVWVWVNLCKAATSMCPWAAYQCDQTLCICLIWMQEAVWGGCQPQPWRNDIMLSPQVTQNPKSEPRSVGITV